MRTRIVIATDCDDIRILRELARRAGAHNVADEYRVSIVQLREATRWSSKADLGTALRQILPPHTPAFVLLQGGHRPSVDNEVLRRGLAAPQIEVIILSAVELENYLL